MPEGDSFDDVSVAGLPGGDLRIALTHSLTPLLSALLFAATRISKSCVAPVIVSWLTFLHALQNFLLRLVVGEGICERYQRCEWDLRLA